MTVFKDEAKNTWYVSINYKDAFDKSRHTTKRGFKLKRDAEEYEHNFFVNLRNDPSITFAQLVEEYLNYCTTRRKKNTVYNKRCIIAKHLLPYFGTMKISDINVKTIIKWQDEIAKNSRQYSDTYIYTLNVVLGAIMNFAIKTQGLKNNPLNLAGKSGKYRRAHDTVWTLQDFKLFITTLRNETLCKSNQIKRTVDTDSLITGYNILYYGGLRLGELLALTLDDIDFERNTIRVTKSYNRILQQDIIGAPKTDNSIRTIDLPSSVMSLIQKYVAKLPSNYPSDSRLFYTLNKNNLRRALHSTAQLAGLPEIRVHDLRHSHASLLFSMGIAMKSVSERLGHASITTTMDVYTHVCKNNGVISRQLDNLINDN